MVNDGGCVGDEHSLGPGEVHEYLSRVMYARRSKMNPLWNSLLVGGFKDGQRCVPFPSLPPFLPSSLFPSLPSPPRVLPSASLPSNPPSSPG